MECYTCLRELLPVVESALAARGFVNRQVTPQEASDGTLTIMTHGSTTILLRDDRQRDMADIEVYSDAQPTGTGLHEILPQIEPRRWTPPSMRRRKWRAPFDR